MPLKSNHRDVINRTLKSDPDYRKYAIDAVSVLDQKPCLVVNLGNDYFKIPFIDIYCQTFREDLVCFEDIVLTAIAWQHILLGQLIYRVIEVHEPPYGDNEIEKNGVILADMVEHYKTRNIYDIVAADFWGGTQDADGFIEFSEPLIRNYRGIPLPIKDTSDTLVHQHSIDGLCTHFPLEIGYCMPDQIEMHLAKTKCVARFPYGYRFIVFFESRRKRDRVKT